MKCNKAHKWIALYREGELEDGIREKLLKHLAECESCNKMVRAYVKNDMRAAQIRSQSIVCEDEDTITNRILDTVAALKKRPGETGFTVIPDRFLGLAMMPAVRRIAVACILILAAVFVYQQVYIFSNTAKLEKQLSAAGKAGLVNAVSKDMQDCLKKSEHLFSKVKTGQIKINKQIDGEISENPEMLLQFASFFCTHKYKYLETSISQDAMIIPDFLLNRALEKVRK